ncbi:tyrosine-type recombinase/integrase [Yersinia ruckeri]|uniref:tyrosine-type recombinase/integrase n=1 Tax=Yersinia ruckeri TaxID=29486 RepID=UPI0022374BAF|nr:integrase arm-type DNA-binding domain-containing protein [Yersinia ruckeri]MCW6542985.1 integrase arm-type DNA-binding domain-containing protein [Yersinia ruckeri]MCW6591433.1 integrase arm-type DNA-binding domain-containing protein [Yersinia ruckeri]UZX90860.1 integrase arm-type DNA-binding domain-containing protein [Yersinia ruckeri]
MPLTDTAIRGAKSKDKPYKLSDAQGLYLLVHSNGSKYWRFRRVINGKDTTRALGSYPLMTLAEARAARDILLKSLTLGIDPLHTKKEKVNTFEEIAREWHSRKKTWSAQHSLSVIRGFEKYLFPVIGQFSIGELTTQDLLEPLRTVESAGKLELASRLQQRITSIMRYAVQCGLIKYNPAQELSGVIETGKSTHRPALPLERIPELLLKIDNYCGRRLTKLAVNLNLLTFIRSSEFRFSRWSEINEEHAIWEIPAQREEIEKVRYSFRGSKMKTPHIVPLSHQAITLFGQIKLLSGDGTLIFPGDHYQYKPMSENTINKALRTMEFDTKTEVCGHGFRAMACSALIESGLWSRDAVERQMSHQERNSVRAAYIHKAEHMEERRPMLQWWADYLDACRDGFIPPYAFKWEKK